MVTPSVRRGFIHMVFSTAWLASAGTCMVRNELMDEVMVSMVYDISSCIHLHHAHQIVCRVVRWMRSHAVLKMMGTDESGWRPVMR